MSPGPRPTRRTGRRDHFKGRARREGRGAGKAKRHGHLRRETRSLPPPLPPPDDQEGWHGEEARDGFGGRFAALPDNEAGSVGTAGAGRGGRIQKQRRRPSLSTAPHWLTSPGGSTTAQSLRAQDHDHRSHHVPAQPPPTRREQPSALADLSSGSTPVAPQPAIPLSDRASPRLSIAAA